MRYADNYCTYTEEWVNGSQFYVFTGRCLRTKERYSVRVPAPELYSYRRGGLIQTAMPSVSPEDREFLISGYSPEGWKQLFGKEEE